MRYRIILLAALLAPAFPSNAQVSVAIGLPTVSIGVNLPVYPEFTRVPGYPVYYAPRVGLNLFFYDGMYWAYHGDNWYASSWYNGPWGFVSPMYVPVYVLRVPVGYYRYPPPYFRGWPKNAPPRWGHRYGERWEHERHGWDDWDRHHAPVPAPLPVYQRHYAGDRYPRVVEQPVIRGESYHYQPSEQVVRQHYGDEAEWSRRYSHDDSKPGKGKGNGKGNGKDNGHGHDD